MPVIASGKKKFAGKPFTIAAALVLACMGQMHLLRAILGWQVTIGYVDVPL
jgi:hypothetical protein